jgi:hypothetical protein
MRPFSRTAPFALALAVALVALGPPPAVPAESRTWGSLESASRR